MTNQLPPIEIEKSLWAENKLIVAGIDEAGRGALAGPIVAAMVILPSNAPSDQILRGVKDSKKMTAKQRDEWVSKVKEHAYFWATGIVSPEMIDEIGIQPANQLAMTRAIEAYNNHIDHHLFDFIHWKNCPFAGQRIKKGESASLSIAAASIIAKTTRDAIMVQLSDEYPAYGWDRNKGYGTQVHVEAIQSIGYTPHHRKSFTLK